MKKLLIILFVFVSISHASIDILIDKTSQTITFQTDSLVSQIDLGELLVDAGELTVIEVNANLNAGSNGFSGADLNSNFGTNYVDGAIIAFSWAATSENKATGIIAKFGYSAVNNVTIKAETMLGSGVGAFIQYQDGSMEDLSDSVIAINGIITNTAPTITSDGGGASAAISVVENSAVATTVIAADDNGDAITYSISGGADAALFSIDSSSGELAFIEAADYENPSDSDEDNVYEVEVTADDGNEGTDSQSISIAVTDTNDAPVISSNGGGDTAAAEVDEGEILATTVVAGDDEGDEVTYSISGGADAALFAIDSATGELTFLAAPEYANPTDSDVDNVYEVEVSATDTNEASDVQAISFSVVQLTPVPKIKSNGGGDTADITVDEGETAVTTVVASEIDGDAITYTISAGDDAELFVLDPNTGELAFVEAADYENPVDSDVDNVYVVEVTATDKDGSDSQIISVAIGDIDDAPVITSDGGGDTAELSIYENETAVTTVTADSAGVSFSIVGGLDAGSFSIDAASGVLTFQTAPSYEMPEDYNSDNVYVVEVAASNSGGGSDIQEISVTVVDVNEYPEITSFGGGETANTSANEQQVAVATISAIDDDGDSLSFIISGGTDASFFAISVSGVVSFLNAPDYEVPGDSNGDNVYNVEITVEDGNGGSDMLALSVTVSDVNDPAYITSNGAGASARVDVEERIAEVTTVVATDQDGDDIIYSISGGVDSALFVISGGGDLYFISAPEYLEPQDSDSNNVYEVEVMATDGNGGTDSQLIRVVIGDAIEPEDAVELDLLVRAKSVEEEHGDIAYEGRLEIGRELTLIATPDNGYRVKKWKGTDGKEATNEQTLMLKKNYHKVEVEFEPVPIQKVTKATFKAGKTRRSHEDSFDIQGQLGAGADHVPASEGTVIIKISDADGNVLFGQTILYDDDNFSNNWPRNISYKDRTILEGKFNYFKYDINSGKFKLSAKSQDLTGWVAPLTLSIDFGSYSAFMLIYDQGANDVVNGNKFMPREFLSGSYGSLTVDKKKIKNNKDNTQSGKVSGRFSTSYSPLTYTLTSVEILIGSYSQVLEVEKHSSKDKYTFKLSKDADPEVQFINKATFDFDKAKFDVSFKNATFDLELETLGMTFAWD